MADYKEMIQQLSALKTKADTDQGRRETLTNDLTPKLEALKEQLPNASVELQALVHNFLEHKEGSGDILTAYIQKRIQEMQR